MCDFNRYLDNQVVMYQTNIFSPAPTPKVLSFLVENLKFAILFCAAHACQRTLKARRSLFAQSCVHAEFYLRRMRFANFSLQERSLSDVVRRRTTSDVKSCEWKQSHTK